MTVRKRMLLGTPFSYLIVTILLCRGISGTMPSVTVSECGETKTCFKEPTSCSGQSDCDFFLSWKPVNRSGQSYLEVEMAGKVRQNTGYIAIGWSIDNKMPASVIESCHATSEGLVKFYSGFAASRDRPTRTPVSLMAYMQTSGAGLGGSYSVSERALRCRYRRRVDAKDWRVGNLGSGQYFVLVALGEMDRGDLGYHEVRAATEKSFELVRPSTRAGSGLATDSTQRVRRFVPVSMDGCGRKKSCFSADCLSLGSCPFFVSWRPVTAESTDWLEVELFGRLLEDSGNVAVGWSHDAFMGDDAVIGCIVQSSGIAIRAAYNPGTYNEFVNSVPDGYIVTSGVSTSGDEPLLGGTFEASTNIVACRFRRQLKPSSNLGKLKDLSSPNKYFILVSRSTSTSAGGLSVHFGGGNAVSSAPFVVGASNFTTAKSSERILVKLHGALMIAAWLLCANVGIVIARYMKPVWPGKTLCGQKVWFQVHRGVQTTAVIMTAAGVVVIFIEIQGYSRLSTLPAAAHPVMGIVVTVLALLNPIMAIFRPAPDASKRPIFNWMHFLVGSLAQIFSVSTMFIGLKLEKLGTDFVTLTSPFWILVGYVIFVVVMEILFSIDFYCLKKKSTRADMHQMKGIQSEGSDYTIDNHSNTADSNAINIVNTKRRSFLLFVHSIGVIGCSGALIILLIIH